MTLHEFDEGMLQYFGIKSVWPYLCKTSLMMNKIQIDPIALDDWLHKKHGPYEDKRHISMATLIIEEYGQDAHQWTQRAIGITD
jgi:arginine utilization protein RocB